MRHGKFKNSRTDWPIRSVQKYSSPSSQPEICLILHVGFCFQRWKETRPLPLAAYCVMLLGTKTTALSFLSAYFSRLCLLTTCGASKATGLVWCVGLKLNGFVNGHSQPPWLVILTFTRDFPGFGAHRKAHKDQRGEIRRTALYVRRKSRMECWWARAVRVTIACHAHLPNLKNKHITKDVKEDKRCERGKEVMALCGTFVCCGQCNESAWNSWHTLHLNFLWWSIQLVSWDPRDTKIAFTSKYKLYVYNTKRC